MRTSQLTLREQMRLLPPGKLTRITNASHAAGDHPRFRAAHEELLRRFKVSLRRKTKHELRDIAKRVSHVDYYNAVEGALIERGMIDRMVTTRIDTDELVLRAP